MKDLSLLAQRVDPFVQSQFGDEMRKIFERVDCGYFRIAPRTRVELLTDQSNGEIFISGMPQVKGYTVACRSPRCRPKETCEIYHGRECKYRREKVNDATDMR